MCNAPGAQLCVLVLFSRHHSDIHAEKYSDWEDIERIVQVSIRKRLALKKDILKGPLRPRNAEDGASQAHEDADIAMMVRIFGLPSPEPRYSSISATGKNNRLGTYHLNPALRSLTPADDHSRPED